MRVKRLKYGDKRVLGHFLRSNRNIMINRVRLISTDIYLEYNDAPTKSTIIKYDIFHDGVRNIPDRLNAIFENVLSSNIQWDVIEGVDGRSQVCCVFWEESNPYQNTIPIPDNFPEECIFESSIGNSENRGEYVTFPDGKKFMAVVGFGMCLVEQNMSHDFINKNEDSFRKRAEGYFLYPR